jgi:hypothetical protein
MQQLPKELAAAVLLPELELRDRLNARESCRQPLLAAASLTVKALQCHDGKLPARAWDVFPVARQLVVGHAGLPPGAPQPSVLDLLSGSVHVPRRLEMLSVLLAGVLSIGDSLALVDTLSSRLSDRALLHLSLCTAITTAAADALLRRFSALEHLRLTVHSLADGMTAVQQQVLLPWAPKLPVTLLTLHIESTEATGSSTAAPLPTVHLDLTALSNLQRLNRLQLRTCRLFNASSLSALRSLQIMDKLSCPVPQVGLAAPLPAASRSRACAFVCCRAPTGACIQRGTACGELRPSLGAPACLDDVRCARRSNRRPRRPCAGAIGAAVWRAGVHPGAEGGEAEGSALQRCQLARAGQAA